MQQIIFIADLTVCSTCFGHYCAHHHSSRLLQRWMLHVVFGALVFKLSVWYGAEGYVSGLRAPSAPHHTDNLKTIALNTTGSNNLYNTLELLMMGIVVPETC